jgi:hypothetical protein
MQTLDHRPKERTPMDRVEAARAWAKVLAYIACGKPQAAKPWAEALLTWWREAGVIE